MMTIISPASDRDVVNIMGLVLQKGSVRPVMLSNIAHYFGQFSTVLVIKLFFAREKTDL